MLNSILTLTGTLNGVQNALHACCKMTTSLQKLLHKHKQCDATLIIREHKLWYYIVRFRKHKHTIMVWHNMKIYPTWFVCSPSLSCDGHSKYFFARSLASLACSAPESFTAFTTVSHVRGSWPVPSSSLNHLVTRSNMQSALPLLSFSMMFISVDSKRRQLPKCLQLGSTWFVSASVISVCHRNT